MNKSKRKLLISMLVAMFVLLSAVAIVAIAFALTQQTITSTLTIGYTVEDIDGSVYATYKIGNGEEKYLVPTGADNDHINNNSLVFKAEDKGNAGSLQFPTADQTVALDSKNDNIILKYTYSNTGGKHYIASMSFAGNIVTNNMEVQYSIDGETYSADRYAVVVPAETDNKSYWIKISIIDKAKGASFGGDFNWVLKGYDKEVVGTDLYESLTTLEFTGNNGSYSASISSSGNYTGTIVFPSAVNGDAVTTITQSSLTQAEKNKVTEVVIPDSVTTIGANAFHGFKGLTEVDLPDGVENLNTYSFYSCSRLGTLRIGKNVSSIGNWAFAETPNLSSIIVDPENGTYYSSDDNGDYNCIIEKTSKKLVVGCKTTIIPSGVKTIGINSFILSYYLTDITIPASVTSIEANPFGGCVRLKNITVETGNSYYYVENNCLIQNSTKNLVSGMNLTSVTIPSDVQIIGEQSFYNMTDLTSVDMPNSVIEVKNNAFLNCISLSNLTLPNSLTKMGVGAFGSCKITAVTIPASVTQIDVNPFVACSSLETIIVEEGNSIYSYQNGCLIDSVTNTLIATTKNFTSIPDSVITIGKSAFAYNRNITSITIPSSVKTIKNSSFNSCTNLKNVTFEVTTGWKAGSTTLTSANLSNTTTAATYLTSTYVGQLWTRS